MTHSLSTGNPSLFCRPAVSYTHPAAGSVALPSNQYKQKAARSDDRAALFVRLSLMPFYADYLPITPSTPFPLVSQC
jgi:hypothetical protein